MNNKFSDIDIVIITIWPFFGAGLGIFVAPLFSANFYLAGAIGLLVGGIVDYVLFFKPWRRKDGLFSYAEETENSAEDEDEEIDISEFIKDSFEAEGIDSEAEVEFKTSSGGDLEEGEEGTETDTSIDSQEEIEDSNDEIDEFDEELEVEETEFEEDETDDESSEESEEDENLEDEDELEAQDAIPAFYTSSDQIHSSLEHNLDRQPTVLQALITPTQLPITIAVLWLFISGYLCSKYPGLTQLIGNYFPVSFFLILPVFFLIGLSGLIGILFREQGETLEISTDENATYLLNLLKIFTGWGVGLYAILVNL